MKPPRPSALFSLLLLVACTGPATENTHQDAVGNDVADEGGTDDSASADAGPQDDDRNDEPEDDAPDVDSPDVLDTNDVAAPDTAPDVAAGTDAEADAPLDTSEDVTTDATADVATDAATDNSDDVAPDVVEDAATNVDGGEVAIDVGESCIDLYEFNNTESTAALLAAVECRDEPISRSLLLEAGDVDWFRIGIQDYFACDSFAVVDVVSTIEVDLCIYVACDSATIDSLDCSAPALPASSSRGRAGCCSDTGRIEIDFDCGTNDDASLYVSVTSTEAVCGDYALQFTP